MVTDIEKSNAILIEKLGHEVFEELRTKYPSVRFRMMEFEDASPDGEGNAVIVYRRASMSILRKIADEDKQVRQRGFDGMPSNRPLIYDCVVFPSKAALDIILEELGWAEKTLVDAIRDFSGGDPLGVFAVPMKKK